MTLTAVDTTDIDRAVQIVADRRGWWAAQPLDARIRLLDACRRTMLDVSDAMVRAACAAKGIPLDAPVAAEEWIAGPMCVIRTMRLLAATLREIAHHGAPVVPPASLRRVVTGQLAVRVVPADAFDRILYAGFTGEVWQQPDVTGATVGDAMGTAYRAAPPARGRVALVLAAGNVASIGPMDALYKLFVENQSVVMKTNPVNDYLRPHLERGLAPLVEAGCLQIVSGGAGAGEHLVAHPAVDEIHLTGSAAVHDRIVWGAPGDEQARTKAAGTPRVRKRVTSELGCVTPVIVVPGRWPERALDYHAAHVATMIANNASFNCNAAKVIVTWRNWPQREAFLSRLRGVLAQVPPRAAYYPGSDRTYDEVVRSHPGAERIGARSARALPWTAVLDVDPERADDPVFRREAWCSLFAETGLGGGDAFEFLQRSVRFCNERLWGTLSATILVDPATERRLGPAFEHAVAALRYGSIGVNVWAAFSYAIGATTWGAFPGHPLDDIGSGRGVVHNTRMFDRPERSVVRGPFVAWPVPVWFVTHRRAHHVARRTTAFEATHRVALLPAIVAGAVRGSTLQPPP